MRILIDAHMVGAHETGNETYIRELARELPLLAPSDSFIFAISRPEARELLGRQPNVDFVEVSEGAAPRLRIAGHMPATNVSSIDSGFPVKSCEISFPGIRRY